MIPPADAVEIVGHGPDLVLVHGTATDRDSWGALARILRKRVRVISYHRRGTPGWTVAADRLPDSASEHAEDLAALIDGLGFAPVHVYGASFGAIVALELCRLFPERVRSAALYEPPVAAGAGAPPVAASWLADFDRQLDRGGPEAAAERFHRRILGDAVWGRLAADARDRARSLWPHIHTDLRANCAHRLRADELRAVDVPVLLLRGERTGSAFDAPLSALESALPRSERRVVDGAGHRIEGRAWVALADTLARFMGV